MGKIEKIQTLSYGTMDFRGVPGLLPGVSNVFLVPLKIVRDRFLILGPKNIFRERKWGANTDIQQPTSREGEIQRYSRISEIFETSSSGTFELRGPYPS